jgi:sigma-B regulation protein RsbU (phosphoserine phosphatase)
MTPGSAVLLYTDGITEAENPAGEAFGTGRLREILAARRWSSAHDLVEDVFAGVRSFSAADPPVDDQTVVAVLHR